MKIAGSTALVTGANRGLGRELAAQLVARGATVYAGARNPDTVDLPGAKVVTIDITDPVSVAAAAEVAGDVTVLINNAGSSTGSDLLGGDLEDIRLEMDTHYFGTLSVVRAFAQKIAANGGGSILNMGPRKPVRRRRCAVSPVCLTGRRVRGTTRRAQHQRWTTRRGLRRPVSAAAERGSSSTSLLAFSGHGGRRAQ